MSDLPSVIFSYHNLEFTEISKTDKLSKTITVSNPNSEALLEGIWSVAPHPSDPPHTPDSHTWILFEPMKFSGNYTKCKVVVDTSRLVANQIYERNIELHANSAPAVHSLTLKIKTAKLPDNIGKPPLIPLALTFLVSLFWGFLELGFGLVGIMTLVIAAFVTVGITMRMNWMDTFSWRFPKILIAAIFSIFVIHLLLIVAWTLKWRFMLDITLSTWQFAAIFLLVYGIGSVAGVGIGTTAKKLMNRGFDSRFAVLISLLTVGLGISLGIGFKVGLLNLWVVMALGLTGIPLGALIFYPPLQQRSLDREYRPSETLIQP